MPKVQKGDVMAIDIYENPYWPHTRMMATLNLNGTVLSCISYSLVSPYLVKIASQMPPIKATYKGTYKGTRQFGFPVF